MIVDIPINCCVRLLHLVPILNPEEAEEPQREPEERTVTVWYLTVEARRTEAGIKVLEDVDSNEQRAATTAREIMRMLAYLEILKERMWPLSRHTSVLDSFKSPLGSRTSPPVLFRHSRCMIHMTGRQFMGNCLFLNP